MNLVDENLYQLLGSNKRNCLNGFVATTLEKKLVTYLWWMVVRTEMEDYLVIVSRLLP